MLRRVWITLVLCALQYVLQGVQTIVPVNPDLGIRNINICKDESSFRCEENELISIVDVSCGYDGGACPDSTQMTISRLCGKQQTCSNAGLKKLLAPVACISPIHVAFQCVPGNSPVCQTNICAADSNGLICPSGNVIHVRHMTCLTPTQTQDCPRSSYSTLFMCEGARQCDASGLRDLLSHLCPKPGDVTGRGVLVEYFCVPESQVDTSCSTSRYHRLKGAFGVIRPPRLDPKNSDINFERETERNDESDLVELSTVAPIDDSNKKKKNKKGVPLRCRWLINPREDEIEVRVHQLTSTPAASPLSTSGATTSFSSSDLCPDLGLLLIKYKDCDDGNQTKVLTLCDKGEVYTRKGQQHLTPPLSVVSCGMIQLTSALPEKDGTTAAVDKLIISYHKIAAYPDQDIPIGISTCPAPPKIVPTQTSSTASFNDDLTVTGLPYGPAAPSLISKKLNPSDGLLGPGAPSHDDSVEQDGPTNSSSRFPNFKLLLLYIIFGVIILALLIALIVVIVSYHRISVRKSRGRGDSGERTALWLYPRHEDTPLETFQTNSMADGSASMTSGSESSHRKVIASVHCEPDTNCTSMGSGMSTFSSGPNHVADNERDSSGLKDLIATFESGTFSGYSSLRDLCGDKRFSTGSAEAQGKKTEYELTDTAPAVIGACDDDPLYVSAGSGHYAGIGKTDHHEEKTTGDHLHREVNPYSSCNGEDHYASLNADGPFASLDGGGLYSTPNDRAHYRNSDSGDYADPNSGHYEGIGSNSVDYEKNRGDGSGHYESLPCADSNIYEAIEPGVSSEGANVKRHSKSDEYRAAIPKNPNFKQHPTVPPPLPVSLSNGGPRYTPLDDFHYRVNNDEYAVVRKPNRQPSVMSSSKSSFASLGRTDEQHPRLVNGDISRNSSNVDYSTIENPQAQIVDQNWKRRSAPTAQNSSWTRGDQWEDVV